MRLPVLLALGLLVGACSSSPEWVSSARGSLCTYDVSGRTWGWPVDVVIVVDDSPSAAPSRPMLRARTLEALRRLVTEPVHDDGMGFPAVHDLHVVIRGVSTSYERRVAYLPNTPDNAWTTPQREARDAETFLAACASALGDVPEGSEETPFIARVSDLRLGEEFLRRNRVVVLFATAHDDTSGNVGFSLREGELGVLVDLSVLADARVFGPSAPPGPQRCGTFSSGALSEAEEARTPVPRLAALVRRSYWARLSLVCTDEQEVADLLFQHDVTHSDYACLPPLPGECTLLIAPPVLGADALCERPDLGLVPTTPDERRFAESRVENGQERPLCHMAKVGGASGPGEGWYLSNDSCGLRFTPWAQPVGGSYIVLHCAGQKCGP